MVGIDVSNGFDGGEVEGELVAANLDGEMIGKLAVFTPLEG